MQAEPVGELGHVAAGRCIAERLDDLPAALLGERSMQRDIALIGLHLSNDLRHERSCHLEDTTKSVEIPDGRCGHIRMERNRLLPRLVVNTESEEDPVSYQVSEEFPSAMIEATSRMR